MVVDHYESTVLEEDHYYPFGLTLQTTPNTNVMQGQPYKYQGIELEKHFGLETYETDFRGLDPQLGRFNSIDPKAEMVYSMSPFVSMGNNPVQNIDPFGDLFRIGISKESSEDINSIVNKKNRKYIKIDEKTKDVTLDFGKMSRENQLKLLASDKGLALIADLSSAKEQYLYDASYNDTKINPSGKRVDETYSPETSNFENSTTNYSTTSRAINGGCAEKQEHLQRKVLMGKCESALEIFI